MITGVEQYFNCQNRSQAPLSQTLTKPAPRGYNSDSPIGPSQINFHGNEVFKFSSYWLHMTPCQTSFEDTCLSDSDITGIVVGILLSLLNLLSEKFHNLLRFIFLIGNRHRANILFKSLINHENLILFSTDSNLDGFPI